MENKGIPSLLSPALALLLWRIVLSLKIALLLVRFLPLPQSLQGKIKGCRISTTLNTFSALFLPRVNKRIGLSAFLFHCSSHFDVRTQNLYKTCSEQRYSTLGSANHVSSPAASTFLIPNRRRLAQTPYTPSGKWKSTSGRMQPLHNPIAFDLKGYSKQGFPMQELCVRGEYALEQMMQGATDQVLAHAPYLRKITIHIRWPGYEHTEWARPIEVVTSRGPISRATLAQAIALNFARFCEKAQMERPQSPHWRIGHGGITFERLVLVSLWNPFEDAWQADVAVDF